MFIPVLQKHSLKTMKRRKPLAWENCRVHDFRVLTQFFAALCNTHLIQSFHLKIVSVFSFCQEIVMIGPILQPGMLIISRRSCTCGKPAVSGRNRCASEMTPHSRTKLSACNQKQQESLGPPSLSPLCSNRCPLPSLAWVNLTASNLIAKVNSSLLLRGGGEDGGGGAGEA